jgi:hypothetical protein
MLNRGTNLANKKISPVWLAIALSGIALIFFVSIMIGFPDMGAGQAALIVSLIVFGLPIAGLFTASVALAFTIIPHELGHYFVGRLVGMRLYAYIVYPWYVQVSPTRKVTLNWNLRIPGAVYMWREDGTCVVHNDFWMILAGPMVNFILAAGCYSIGAFGSDSDTMLWSSFGFASLLIGISSLISATGKSGVRSDGRLLFLIMSRPREYRCLRAMGQMNYYIFAGMKPSTWPNAIVDRAHEDSGEYKLRRDLFQTYLAGQWLEPDFENLSREVDFQVSTANSWPISALKERAQVRQFAAISMARNFYLREPTRHWIPGEVEVTGVDLATRLCLVAAMAILDGRLDEARAILDAPLAPARKGKPPEWVARQSPAAANVRPMLESFSGPEASIHRLACEWQSGLRPRDWNPVWVEEIKGIVCSGTAAAYRDNALLQFHLDRGEFDAAEALIEKIESSPPHKEAGTHNTDELWLSISMFYSLNRPDLDKAEAALARANARFPQLWRSKAKAEAAIHARKGHEKAALELIRSVREKDLTRPSWFPVYNDDLECLDRIEQLARQLGP